MHIEVDGSLSVKEGHDLSEKIERELKIKPVLKE